MNKKIMLIVFAIMAALICAFGLIACKDGDNEQGGDSTIMHTTHSYGDWSSDGDVTHSRECSCGDKQTENHKFVSGACSECGAIERIKVTVYIDGAATSTAVYATAANGYKITAPQKPEDITTNPNSEKYFYGWFVDANYQTPLTENHTFTSEGKIYGKWINIYSNDFTYTVSKDKATITGFKDVTATVVVVPAYINASPVVTISGAFKNKTQIRTVIICDGITTIDTQAFYGCDSIKTVVLPDSLKSIGSNAFYGCAILSSIEFPDGLTTIGNYAFSGCTALDNVTVPDSVTSIGNYAFSGCTELSNMTIGTGVKTIGDYAFSGCTALDNVTVPDSVTSIGNYAFNGCTALDNVTVPDSVTSIGNYAFRGCTELSNMTMGTGVKTIGDYAFSGCTALETLTVPDSVTSIGNCAFSNCKKLSEITVGARVQSISGSAFNNCTEIAVIRYNGNLTGWCGISGVSSFTNPPKVSDEIELYIDGQKIEGALIIPSGVQEVPYGAFRNCKGITSVTIGKDVTNFSQYAFEGCSAIESLTVDGGNTAYKSSGNCIIQKSSKRLVLGCKNSVIPTDNTVTVIGAAAFENCTSLTSISIPASVTKIEAAAFKNCTSLTTITIPYPVSSIEREAFNGCTGLTIAVFSCYVWSVSTSYDMYNPSHIGSNELTNQSTAARYLTDDYSQYYWVSVKY